MDWGVNRGRSSNAPVEPSARDHDPATFDSRRAHAPEPTDPSAKSVLFAILLAIAVVGVTRTPVARLAPLDSDERGFLAQVRLFRFPIHHTLYLTTARQLGDLAGDAYRGFLAVNMLLSAVALVSIWWFLRALVGPKTAATCAGVLCCGPVFWAYGAMAGNYPAIPLVGSFLLGIAIRGRTKPKTWHPYAAALVFAFGTGLRQDIGVFWSPVFLVVLWQHRWLVAAQSGLLFTAGTLAWIIPMLHDAGGWTAYRQETSEFAYKAGYLNSIWHLGVIDAPVRYAVKAVMALLWTLGPGLLFVPRGFGRLLGGPGGVFSASLMICSLVPTLMSHLLVHFGVAGYSFHYVPAVVGCMALGLAPLTAAGKPRDASGARRAAILATLLAAIFLCYPTNYDAQGLRGNFDLSFARHTRIGLNKQATLRDPALWRTSNSQVLPGGSRPHETRQSLSEIWTK
jgi:hypothetical protein